MVRVIKGKSILKRSEGIQNLLRPNGRFELLRLKLQSMYEENPGEIDFGSSYRESTVLRFLRGALGSIKNRKTALKLPKTDEQR